MSKAMSKLGLVSDVSTTQISLNGLLHKMFGKCLYIIEIAYVTLAYSCICCKDSCHVFEWCNVVVKRMPGVKPRYYWFNNLPTHSEGVKEDTI